MPGLSRLVIALGAWLVSCAAGATALDTLDGCATRASPGARGLAALEAQCPGLESALRELGYAGALPEGWRDTLSRRAVGDLADLAHRYQGSAARPAPEVGALRAVLDQLASEQKQPGRSWWDAVREWLRSWLARQDGGSVPWLDRLLKRLAPSVTVIQIFTYVLLALTVVAAVWFILNELRVAGLLSRRGREGAPRPAAATAPNAPVPAAVADLDTVALRDQPAVLLRLLVGRLLANGQLGSDRTLTHRELVTRSAFADPQNREQFARVAQLAERVLYGGAAADSAQAGAVIADGRRLLLQLQTAGMARA